MKMPTEELLRRITHYVKSGIVDNPNSSSTKLENSSPISRLEDVSLKLNMSWKVDEEFFIRSHRRLIGGVVVLVKRLIRKALFWYMHPFKAQQTAFNMYSVQSINEIRNALVTWRAVQEQSTASIGSLEKRLREIQQPNVRLIEEVAESVAVFRREFESRLTSLDQHLQKVVDRLDNQYGLVDNSVTALRETVSNFENQLELLSARVWRLKEQSRTAINDVLEKPERDSNVTASKGPEFDYLSFEARYRGSFDLIKSRQQKYLANILTLDDVVDVGCGRGEFISLVVSSGKKAVGVEMNEDMYSIAKSKGLPVVLGDGIEYLKTRSDASLGVIFCAHVVEHLEFNKLMEFLEVSSRKLRHGGKLIVESPNPTTLMIFANTFYMDPTHVRPVHPETLQFMMKSVGFQTVTREETEAAVDWNLPVLTQEAPIIQNIEQFNDGIRRLNRILYGPQDYAIIATR